ncbi:hypothetical protein C4K00_2748 [Pseudomonas synxantha]|nr:hypothetical protein C4K00_2748 [Pseudomonas synxantha]AZE78629.1 hypothetical protein C4J99_2844 [Pseudomonas synxantha]
MAVYQDGVLIRTELSAAVFDTDEIPHGLLMSHIEANPSASAQLNHPTIEALRRRP